MLLFGEVAEWFNAAVLKTVEGASPPRVRISASPPLKNPEHKFRIFLLTYQFSAFYAAEEEYQANDDGQA